MDKEYLQNFMEKMRGGGLLYDNFYKALRGGKNEVFLNVVSEAVTLDDSWILTLEGALHSIEQIARNPRKFIIDEELIVDVERARRTNAKTIRHLASNTKNIQSISESGEVRPKKLLTTEMQEDLAIYENRFVCALVQRLVTFVEQRYNDINGKMHMYDITNVNLRSNFHYGESEVECGLFVKMKEPPHDKVLLERNRGLLEKVKALRRRLKILQSTDFMRQLNGKKPVHPPIMKTNLIKMNVDYQNCYKLWLYISSYTFVGYSVEVKDKNLPVDGDYFDDLTVLAGLSVQSLFTNKLLKAEEYENIPFGEPKRKNYKVVTKYKFMPSFAENKKTAGEDTVNEFYFRQMKNELVKATGRGTLAEEKQLKMNFQRFFKAIEKINNAMLDEVIASQIPAKKDLLKKTAIQKKEQAVKDAQFTYRRYQQISRLRREELEKSLKKESRELLKLEKLKAELDREKGKRRDRQEQARKKKAQLERIKAKKLLAEQKAKLYEEGLREKDAAKSEELEEAKRRKREEAKRKRELKKLEELREKYDGLD